MLVLINNYCSLPILHRHRPFSLCIFLKLFLRPECSVFTQMQKKCFRNAELSLRALTEGFASSTRHRRRFSVNVNQGTAARFVSKVRAFMNHTDIMKPTVWLVYVHISILHGLPCRLDSLHLKLIDIRSILDDGDLAESTDKAHWFWSARQFSAVWFMLFCLFMKFAQRSENENVWWRCVEGKSLLVCKLQTEVQCLFLILLAAICCGHCFFKLLFFMDILGQKK